METKQVLLKSYYHFSILEKAIKMICKNSMEKIKVSVLGNFVEKYATSTNDVVNKRNYIATFFESLFDENYELDSFYNPDIGRVFVTGFLVPMFLQQVGDKKLGALSGGPYGILRGLGISEATANAYVKKLINGEYLLVARGDCIEIERLKTTLDGLQNYVGRKNDKP